MVSRLNANTSGRGGDDLVERGSALRRVVAVAEVARQHLDADVGGARPDLADGLGHQPRALVVEVVAGDHRHDGEAQAEVLDRLGDAPRLVDVVALGLAGLDLAEPAAAGAVLAADQERRLAHLPALVDVGAAGLRADGVELEALHQLGDVLEVVTEAAP